MWWIVRPLFFLLPPEFAHYFSMGLFSSIARIDPLRSALERFTRLEDPRLRTEVCGLKFSNPVGLAAGFDKDARWFQYLDSLGFGSIEIGSITGQGQPGNPPPRLFRLPRDKALINRMGFNNRGADIAARNLATVNCKRFRARTVLGVNLGKTKSVENENAADDYSSSFRKLFPFADYFVINVSSPNTPGLRSLQEREPLIKLLKSIGELNRTLATEKDDGSGKRPVFLKIAPDLTDGQLDDVCEIAQESFVDGIIATNTTLSRHGLRSSPSTIGRIGAGGLSGRPLFAKSLSIVARLFLALKNKKPIIGVGGIFDGDDAWEMIAAGASLVQIYTGFVYGGPGIVARINRRLIEKLDQQKLKNIGEAVGMRHHAN